MAKNKQPHKNTLMIFVVLLFVFAVALVIGAKYFSDQNAVEEQTIEIED